MVVVLVTPPATLVSVLNRSSSRVLGFFAVGGRPGVLGKRSPIGSLFQPCGARWAFAGSHLPSCSTGLLGRTVGTSLFLPIVPFPALAVHHVS